MLPPRGLTLERPSLIVYLDSATRAIMGYALSFTHTADDALAGLRHAILPDDELGPFCGVPTRCGFDNAMEFLSDAFSDALGHLGIQPMPAAPYTPYQKGKVERLHLDDHPGVLRNAARRDARAKDGEPQAVLRRPRTADDGGAVEGAARVRAQVQP